MDPGEPLYDTEAVRALDRAAIAGGVPGFALMQRAARAVFDDLRARWPEAARVLVACGRGNNGGDGYLLAGLLREAGCAVWVCGAEPGAKTSDDARRAREAWERHGPVQALDRLRDLAVDLVVDALLGIGVDRAPEGEIAEAIDAINATGAPVYALDVPSGLDAQRGSAGARPDPIAASRSNRTRSPSTGAVVRATRSITFIVDKTGLHTGVAREVCGELVVANLAVDAQGHAPAANLIRPSHLTHWLRPRSRDAHKGRHGHVLCVGGDHGMGGAIRLCAEAALRSGAGWVSVATRAEHVAPLLTARPEAMTRAVEEAAQCAPLIERTDVIALGPGLGQGEWGRALLAAALRSGKPCVLDADALNLIASDDARTLAAHVITPHPGEAARLLRCTAPEIESDRYAAAARLAETFQTTVVLKGAGTLIAAPQRTTAVVAAGNPGMASAGMGDVLTGVIAALRAQGLGAFDAACAGALLHAHAGDRAAAARGERGLLASDLFDPLQRGANP